MAENKDESRNEQGVFYAKQNEKLQDAYAQAQQTFKYFWRELYWEYRRIIPALDLAIVKIPFEQKFDDRKEPVVEHMWINQIDFDGELIYGVLVNSPNELTNISEGDKVSVGINNISDWMFVSQGKTYGGYTIHALRSDMNDNDREQHDNAWGLDFGDYDNIQVVFEQKKHPENLIEHPMCKNMEQQVRDYFKENPKSITAKNENGLTELHHEAIAGNKTTIDILLEIGADKSAKTVKGLSALDYAKLLDWKHLIPVLEGYVS